MAATGSAGMTCSRCRAPVRAARPGTAVSSAIAAPGAGIRVHGAYTTRREAHEAASTERQVTQTQSRSMMSAGAAVTLACLSLPADLSFGQPPASALVNQRSQATLEAARAASPHTAESTYAYFEQAAEAFLAAATERVWDPSEPRPEPPRTPWGDPSLAGYWSFAAYTPLERPEALADTPLYTREEAIEVFRQAVVSDASVDPATVHYDWTEFGLDNWQSPIRPNRRTSMIVDPPDGRVPALTPGGTGRLQAQQRGHTLESRGLAERCILGNDGPPNVPFSQNTGHSQIIQTPDHVLLITEENSDVRIIPLDDSPHAPADVRSWLGDARGRWEGETLVVETTNFHEQRKWEGSAGELRLVERFTRVADDTLLWEATLSDPTTWEAPWTVEVPLPRMDREALYEFACHELNYGIINVVRGARARAAEYAAGSPR